MNETWEMSTLDWRGVGADGLIASPKDVALLIFAENEKQARDAFFLVSEVVGQNGLIYSCALTITRTVLAALPACGTAARDRCLELISQIGASQSAPNSQNIKEDCLLEIRNLTWYFIHGLQFDRVEAVGLYVDILGCLAMRFDDLRPLVKKYLNLALTRNLPTYDVPMIRNTIAELLKGDGCDLI